MGNDTIHLSHLSLNKIVAISQKIVSNAFSWTKSFVFWFEFHWSLFPGVQLTVRELGSGNGLAPNRRQAITWTDADSVNQRIYAALGENSGKRLPHLAHDMANSSNVINIMIKSVRPVA